MAVYGNVGPFDEENEKFEDYADRFTAFTEVNGIVDDKKTNLFLATVGPNAYRLVKNLCSPAEPKSKTLDELISLLKGHYAPEPIIIAERHKFWTAVQGDGEGIADFIVRLKKLSSTCEFGTFLEEALRDRLVSGLHKSMNKAQRTLFTVRNLTFKEAKDRCIAEELAAKATKEYTSLGEEVAVENKVTGRPRPKVQQERPDQVDFQYYGRPSCRCCGSDSHKSETCKFRQAVCHFCKKRGHIKYACKYGGNSGKTSLRKNRPTSVHTVEEEVSLCESEARSLPRPKSNKETFNTESDGEVFGIYNSKCAGPKPYIVKVNIGNVDVNMELDTGATFSTLSEILYKKQFGNFPLKDISVTLRSYTDTIVPVLGSICVPVTYKGNPTYNLDVLVVKGKKPALFGRDWLRYFNIDWQNIVCNQVLASEIKKIQVSEGCNVEFKELLKQNDVLFCNDNTGIREFTATLKLKPDVKPVFQKSRPVPYSISEKVEAAYDKLIKADVLYPRSNSRWASPVVHVQKTDGSIRVCGDYKAVNKLISFKMTFINFQIFLKCLPR